MSRVSWIAATVLARRRRPALKSTCTLCSTGPGVPRLQRTSRLGRLQSLPAPQEKSVDPFDRTPRGPFPGPYSPATDSKRFGLGLVAPGWSTGGIFERRRLLGCPARSPGTEPSQGADLGAAITPVVRDAHGQRLCGSGQLSEQGLASRDGRGYQLKLPFEDPLVSLSPPIDPQGNGNGQH